MDFLLYLRLLNFLWFFFSHYVTQESFKQNPTVLNWSVNVFWSIPWFAFVYRCQHCNCHPAGAISGTCHLVTGQCVCKQFVTGLKCDNCVPNASNLDVHNLFGCSKSKWMWGLKSVSFKLMLIYWIKKCKISSSVLKLGLTFFLHISCPEGLYFLLSVS